MNTKEILELIDGCRARGVTSFRHIQDGSDLAFSCTPAAAPVTADVSQPDTLSVTSAIDMELFGQDL